jgi:NADH-quinone oxidoreductase subunit M
MIEQHQILSVIIFLPVIAALFLFIPGVTRRLAFGWATLASLAELALAIFVMARFSPGISGFQFGQSVRWIGGFGINYVVGIDGISLFLMGLTALLTPICIGASYRILDRQREYLALMLLLETGLMGIFLSLNLFLFYIFWEVMLVPMYFLIGGWGGPRRIYAVVKFVIYTAFGSLLMLIGIIAIGAIHQANTGTFTLDLPALLGTHFTSTEGIVLFLAFFAAFAIKVPLVPFHSWLPDAYTEAPTPVTIMLASAMTKAGAYGFIRFCLPLFPQASRTLVPLVSILALIGIIYCAVLALVQDDIKRLISYSSISHLGVIMLGIFALNMQGVAGGILQMANHGIITAALFLIAGFVEVRTGTRSLRAFGGLATKLPVLATLFLISALASLGLPGLNSFAGEFLALLGAFRANVAYGTVGTLVIIPAAWYLIRFFQDTMHWPIATTGPVATLIAGGTALADATGAELAVLLPLVLLMFYLGFQPAQLVNRMQVSISDALTARHVQLVINQPAPSYTGVPLDRYHNITVIFPTRP